MTFEKNELDLLYELAQKNTIKNKNGHTMITKDDDSYYDDIWDKAYEESLNEGHKAARYMVG